MENRIGGCELRQRINSRAIYQFFEVRVLLARADEPGFPGDSLVEDIIQHFGLLLAGLVSVT